MKTAAMYRIFHCKQSRG